jgi:hypothetical protein
VNKSPLPSPADRLTDLSHRLSAGADAWEADNEGRWLVAPLIAMIAAFIKEIAESLAQLAALIRDGKLVPQPAPAPRQGNSRPASKPTEQTNESRRTPAATAQTRFPLPEPETAALPPPSPESPSQTPRSASPRPGARRPTAPETTGPASAWSPPAHWHKVRPKPEMAWDRPAPWHAHIVAIS